MFIKLFASGLTIFGNFTLLLRMLLNNYAYYSPIIYEYVMSENEPLNGKYPVSNTYKITPKAQTSLGFPL